MDKRALKSTIIELKENNKTYQEISDILAKEYDVHMSRQAVCGMYNRATSDDTIIKNKEMILATNDVINYHVLGIDNKQVKEIIQDIGYKLSLGDIEYIIKINEEYSISIERELIYKLIKELKMGNEINEIKAKITYKGIQITNNKYKELIKKSVEQMIYDESARVLSRVYNCTSDKTLIKDIIAEHNMNITLKDIENKKYENNRYKIQISQNMFIKETV